MSKLWYLVSATRVSKLLKQKDSNQFLLPHSLWCDELLIAGSNPPPPRGTNVLVTFSARMLQDYKLPLETFTRVTER